MKSWEARNTPGLTDKLLLHQERRYCQWWCWRHRWTSRRCIAPPHLLCQLYTIHGFIRPKWGRLCASAVSVFRWGSCPHWLSERPT
ncbi:unnamed protein product [Ixodes persulcatus]